jgi:hypothetical protein
MTLAAAESEKVRVPNRLVAMELPDCPLLNVHKDLGITLRDFQPIGVVDHVGCVRFRSEAGSS